MTIPPIQSVEATRLPAPRNKESLRLAGPLFWWEALRQSRRGRGHFLRLIYACLLLSWLWFILGRGDITPKNITYLTEVCVNGYLALQYLAVLVLAPLFVVSSIIEDRQRRTYELLLTTHLSAREILLDKMGSRMVHVLSILVAGLPILSLLQVLGGVNIVTVWLHSLAALFLLAAVSAYAVRAATVCETVAGGVAVCWAVFHAASAPALILALVIGPHMGLTVAAITFALIHLLPALLSLKRAIRALERREPTILEQEFTPPVRLGAEGPTLDATKHDDRRAADRKRIAHSMNVPPVSERPVIWKERFFPIPDLGCLVAMAFMMICMFSLLFILVTVARATEGGAGQGAQLLLVMVMLNVLVPLVVVCLRAAVTFSDERERQTMDALLVLPYAASQMVRDKWLGCLARSWPLLGIMLIALLAAAVQLGRHVWAAVPVWLLQFVVYTMLALRLSLTTLSPLQSRIVLAVVLLFVNAMLPLWHTSLQSSLPPPLYGALCLTSPWLTMEEVWNADAEAWGARHRSLIYVTPMWPDLGGEVYFGMLATLAAVGVFMLWRSVVALRR